MAQIHDPATVQILMSSNFTVNHGFLKEQRPTQYCPVELSTKVDMSYIFPVQ